METGHVISIDDLGSSFLDALKVWDKHLYGTLEWNHEVAAAHRYFTEVMGARWSPGVCPTNEQMEALEKLAPIMDAWKSVPHLFTRRSFSAMIASFKPALDYVNASFGVTVVAAYSPIPQPVSHTKLVPFEWVIRHTKILSSDDRPEFTGSVAARQDNNPPDGFPIKGNLDSLNYHKPDGRWYKQTVAEVWFADEESAKSAGFALPKSMR